MSEFRERLRPYLNKRVKIRGTFHKFDEHWHTGFKQTGRGCIVKPEISGEIVASYVWAVGVPHWEQFRDQTGAQVTFDALVQEYRTRGGNEINYCLANAGKLEFINPPALYTPLPMADPIPLLPAADPMPPAKTVAAPAGSIEKIKEIKAWAKQVGGFEVAEQVLSTLPNIPLPELLEFLSVLKD